VLLLDVTPLSLGVETLGGVMTSLITRNTTIPTTKSETFSTAEDGQTAVDIHVLQGERPMAGDNMTLGKFRLEGIPPAPRGIPQVEVTFDIDANGILNVKARDKATGREQKITITASTNLDKRDIERMVEEARKHSTEDQRRKALIEARNQGDNVAYQADKSLRDMGDKLGAEDRRRVEEKIEQLREALKGEDVQRIQQLTHEVQQVSMSVGQSMYNQQPGGQPGQPGDGGQPGPEPQGQQNGEDVVEGEFRQV